VIVRRFVSAFAFTCSLLLMLAPPWLLAAEPIAKVTGPKTAVVGVKSYFDVSGCVFDPEFPLFVAFADDGDPARKPTIEVLYSGGPDRKPTDLKVTPVAVGRFYLVVSATGQPHAPAPAQPTPPTPPTPPPAADPTTVTRTSVWPLLVTKVPVPEPDNPVDPDTPVDPDKPVDPDVTPTTVGAKLGKAFGPQLAGALADGFETAATMIAAGTSVKDADEALKVKFQASRNAAFAANVGPTFAAIVPEGAEPTDAATRAAFVKIHRDFAKGLRGGGGK
jgi:hypothetical protein